MNPLSTFWMRAKERKVGLGWIVLSWLALSVALGVSIWFYAYKISMQISMATWASYAGKLQASVWFQDGRYRILELSSDDKSQFTGRIDGPFEIWTWTHYTDTPSFTVQTADETFVETFNSQMRQLWDGKQMKAKPNGAANRSQSIRAETNRTSVVAGSDR